MIVAIIASIRRVVGPPPPYSPASLFTTGQQGAWYDPSDFASMFQDTAGTIPITATGQAVARINDKSGRGNHATQALAAARPLLQIDAGGKYYLDFDGVDDDLVVSAINFSGATFASVFAGFRKQTTNLYQVLVKHDVDVSTTNYTLGFYVTWDATAIVLTMRSTIYGGPMGSSVGLPALVVSTGLYDFGAANPSATLRVNGAEQASANVGGTPGAISTNALRIGGSGGSSYLNGRIYSLILRGAASTATEITDTEAFVNSKTGAY